MPRIDIDKTFTYQPPKGDQGQRYETLRELARQFAHAIVMHTPESAEQTTAIRYVQQAIMWANASIAINE